jgi:hypothetical protein
MLRALLPVLSKTFVDLKNGSHYKARRFLFNQFLGALAPVASASRQLSGE